MDVFVVVGEEGGDYDAGATLVARATSTPNAYDLIGVRRRIYDDTREVFSGRDPGNRKSYRPALGSGQGQ